MAETEMTGAGNRPGKEKEMTQLERLVNFLRYGEAGDYIETNDGTIRVTRRDNFYNTLPHCYITENGKTREADSFYGDTVEIVKRMIEIDG